MTTLIDNWEGLELAAGRYRVAKRLGQGGMGCVYHARDNNLQTDVVIKVPLARMLQNPQFAARFQQEIRSLVQLQHPHIVQILDVSNHAGVPYAVMRYLAGGSLRDRFPINSEQGTVRPMPIGELDRWLLNVAEALDFIHRNNCVHRDVKPENILFDRDGNVYLSDFGIAKVLSAGEWDTVGTGQTATGTPIGTARYIAPERVLNQVYDGRVDQYSLAVMLWELLSGRLPFLAPFPAAVLVMHIHRELEPLDQLVPGIPATVSEAVRRGLAKNPAHRYLTCADFAQAVLRGTNQAIWAKAPQGPAGIGAPSKPPPLPSSLPTSSTVRCRFCQTLLKIPSAAVGHKVQCPNCMQTLNVRSRPTAAQAPLQPTDIVVDTAAEDPTALPPVDLYPPAPGPYANLTPYPQGGIAPLPQDAPRSRVLPAAIAGGLLGAVLLVVAWLVATGGFKKTEPTAGTTTPALTSAVAVPTPPQLPKFVTNSIGMKLVLVRAGKFRMGSPADEPQSNADEDPPHEVEITKSFYLGVTEVTQEQYEKVMGNNPSYFAPSGNGKDRIQGLDHRQLPVDNVNWHDAVEFCRRLSDLPEEKKANRVYRIPFEAEWEYACRAGTQTPVFFGTSLTSTQANMDGQRPYGNAPKGPFLNRTTTVGSYPVNDFGLYDMHGNVWEWCQDWYGDKYYLDSPRSDPPGPVAGQQRVIRGGCWDNDGNNQRSAHRFWAAPTDRNAGIGMRVLHVAP